MRRAALLLSFTLLFGLAFAVAQGDWRPGEVRKIADGVWFRLGDIEQYGHCNNTIIEMQDYLIVVDANFPSGAEMVMDAVKKLSSKPVRYVFDTHHHGDHAYGNSVWTAAGATTIAFVGVAEEMRRYEPTRWQQASKDREDVREQGRDSVEPPQETFDKSPHVIEDGSRRVELYHFGWAHTRGDGFAYLPKEKVIATGDAIVNGAYNFTGDGNTGNWPNVIRHVKKLDIEHVLPGHGPAGGIEIVNGQLAFFEELNRAVEKEFKAKRKLEDVVTVKDGAGVATTVKLSDAVQNWVGGGFPEQVRVRWEELAQGKPHGEITGGK